MNKIKLKDCDFVGVKWDKEATEAVIEVAKALHDNAIALRNLTELFKSQNIKIDTLFTVVNDPPAEEQK